MSEKDKYTRDEDKRFTLRINKELFAKLEESARKHKRAIGREIEYILEMELSDKPYPTLDNALNSFKTTLELDDLMPKKQKMSKEKRAKYEDVIAHPEKYDLSHLVSRFDL